MKTKMQHCSQCNEETPHNVGKKQATSKSNAYVRRRTSKCKQCGKREIDNIKTRKKTIIAGKNSVPEIN